MKKSFISKKIPFLLISVYILNISCRHEVPGHIYSFKIILKIWYRVSPTLPVPVSVNGIPYVALANLVVKGDGTATQMDNVKSFANTLSYSASVDGAPSGAIGAPVTDIPGYTVLGGPLPLIQVDDFSAVPTIISRFGIPASVGGHVVNLALFNKSGDAIFLSNIPGTGTSVPISARAGGYTNKTLIVGGAGRFKYATGELSNSGHFSFIAPFDGEDDYEGWISN